MIKLPLLLAVVLSVPAAAQSDASFAAALGTLPSGLAVMAQLKTAPQAPAPAQVQGPTAPAALWAKVFKNAADYGEISRPDGWKLISYSLEEKLVIRPNMHEQTYSMDFLALPDGNDRVRPGAALFTVMEAVYKPATKQATRQSWVFETNGNGRLTSAKRYLSTYTETADGKVAKTDAPVETLALDDELTGEMYTAMLEFWGR